MTKKKKDIQLDDFWSSNDGKLIEGMGTWLLVYGFIIGVFSVVFLGLSVIVLFRNPLKMPPATALAILYYTAIFGSSVFLMERGKSIRKRKLSPSQTRSTSIFAIVFVAVQAALTAIVGVATGSIGNAIIGLLDLITLIDAIRYLAKSHDKYVAATEGCYEPEGDEPRQEENDEEPAGQQDDGEYYDDML